MAGQVVLLLWSPRVAPGLLSCPAWDALRAGDVYFGDPAHPQLPALRAADVSATLLEGFSSADLARRLIEVAGSGPTGSGPTAVWLAGVDGDPGLGEALARELVPLADPPELEILPGSYDLPGARLIDLVRVMDRLRRECPWVQAQDHRSLVRYLVEEAYEAVEALETDDRTHVREELGDLLFQVVFHARLAEESPDDAWSIDEVAGDLTEKLIRRNPHVFAGGTAADVGEIENVWDQLKSEEKRRTSAIEGVPSGLPALALADKLLERIEKSSHPEVFARVESVRNVPADAEQLGETLLTTVAAARAAGIDPEQALRDAVRRLVARIQDAEAE